MRTKFSVSNCKLTVEDVGRVLLKAVVLSGQKWDEIPEGYPHKGFSIQIFGPETVPEQVVSAVLNRDADGYYVDLEFQDGMPIVFSSNSEFEEYIDGLKKDGWEISLQTIK